MTLPDKRRNAWRDDLADKALEGKVPATAFRKGKLMQFMAPASGVHRAPRADAMQLTQALWGETAMVFERKRGWAWVQLTHDRYVGYVRAEDLSDTIHEATHRVAVPSTFLYPQADLKSQPAIALPMNAVVRVDARDGDYAGIAGGGFVFLRHLSTINEPARDFVAVAERFLETPYLWGGKSAYGIDCSGLVQVALEACGLACPRDSDMQEQELGTQLRLNDLDGLKRGDLVFWKGHVGIMTDSATLLHANGHHMNTVKEPLAEAMARISAKGSDVTAIKRL